MSSVTAAMLPAAGYVQRHDRVCEALNGMIYAGFMAHAEQPERRSHFFAGRFENIYIDVAKIPALATVLARGRQHAAEITGHSAAQLQAGCWFNAMRPGDLTLPHTHDDDNEVLSAVYYVRVPAAGGDFVLHTGAVSSRLTPQAGSWIFFAPDRLHEVTRNESDAIRLSLGINFGLRAPTGPRTPLRNSTGHGDDR